MKIIKSNRLKNVPVTEEIAHTIGGVIGKLKGDDIKNDTIGVQFAYRNGTEKELSKIFLLDPPHARFLGRHLLYRGIQEGINQLVKHPK